MTDEDGTEEEPKYRVLVPINDTESGGRVPDGSLVYWVKGDLYQWRSRKGGGPTFLVPEECWGLVLAVEDSEEEEEWLMDNTQMDEAEAEAELPDFKGESAEDTLSRLADEEGFNLDDFSEEELAEMHQGIRDRGEDVHQWPAKIHPSIQEVMIRPTTTTISNPDRLFILVAMAIMLVVPWVLSTYVPTPEPPVVNVEAPAITIDGSEIAGSLMARGMDFDPQTGMFMPLPPAAEDADVFRETCRDVCRSTARFGSHRRDGEESAPAARVLVNDPENQICTCFTGTTIWRYVEWNRR